MSSDLLDTARTLIADHSLLETDAVLRALVREVERLRKIEASARAYRSASIDCDADEATRRKQMEQFVAARLEFERALEERS